MTLAIEVAGRVTGSVTAVGVPVLAGTEGPEWLGGGPPDVAALAGAAELPARLDGQWCARRGFRAKTGQVLVLRSAPAAAPTSGGTAPADGTAPAVVLLGLGGADGLGPERWRRAAAALVRSAGEGDTAAMVLPVSAISGSGGAAAVGAAAAEGAVLAAYRFDGFRTTPKPEPVARLVLVAAAGTAPPGGDPAADLGAGAERGARGARATCLARDLVNTPPSDLTPRLLADRVAAELAPDPDVTVEVWDEPRIAAERLGGLLGVSRGSAEPPRLVRAAYEPPNPATVGGRVPHVVLVGKGITFDSGGLSLKTPEGMTTMKTDMSGAAIVLAAVAACGALDVPVRVTAIAPITENMPGGRAIKPGDVLTVRDGQTIEVLNTDAEGRLVLADGLVLASELEPDAVVDVATLTGAATVALGRGVAPLFGNDEQLVELVRRCGADAGEPLWPMPLPEEYADHIDSDVADMKNVGRPGQAGSIAAAMLLSRFAAGVPWAHLDIAGTGRAAEDGGYLSKGGTGFGVRTLLRLLGDYAAWASGRPGTGKAR